ncbi:hypothetical protein BGX20_006431, partial [Mortierella sp. AD010]
MEPNNEVIKKTLLQQFSEDKSKMNNYWNELEEKENNVPILVHYKKIKKATQDQCQEAVADIVEDVRDIARRNRESTSSKSATIPVVSSTSVAVSPSQVGPEPYNHSTVATSLTISASSINDDAASSSTQALPVSQYESSASSSSSSSSSSSNVAPSDSTSSLTDVLDSTLTTNAMSNSIPN